MPKAGPDIKAWIGAFRLRTLPLSLSCILMGGVLAAWQSAFNWTVFGLAVATTTLLQILSNLANDYGDSVHGADSADRQGPTRAVQQGLISPVQMKRAMVLFSVLSLASGIGLLLLVFYDQLLYLLAFLGLGVAAIFAAINYTAGSNPYGYRGLGDLAVFLFFGIVGVAGTYFLLTGDFDAAILLPAASCGLFATGVLNVNNIRDIESDQKAGKISIPVRIGRKKAVTYHIVLLLAGVLAAAIFTWAHYTQPSQWLFLFTMPLFYRNARAVQSKHTASALDPYLKQLALSTLLFVVLFGLGLLLPLS